MSRSLALILLLLCSCNPRPTLPEGQLDPASIGKSFQPGFLFGTATAAHQIEGGNDNDWTRWEQGSYEGGRPHIKNADQSGRATDSWNKFDQDLQLMKDLHSNAYRFSIEWSRVQPTRDTWNEAALTQYLQWAQALRQNGIEPMVTLFHFSLPKWVADQGGFESDQTVEDFDAFVRHVSQRLGGEVDLWCTLNEPNVYVTFGYVLGEWPPGKSDQKLGAEVLTKLAVAHARAAKALRETDTLDADGDGRATQIGIAHHVRIFQPATQSVMDESIAGLTDDFFNESFPAAVKTGRMKISIPGTVEIDQPIDGLEGSFDFLGLNYYTRDYVRADLSDPSLSHQYVPRGRPTSDLGWDLYPEGMYLLVKRFSAYGWPIYITENGIADQAGDTRPQFLLQHLSALEKAANEGADVRGYFHWALLDNFEWAEGFGPRFGLFSVDYSDPALPRKPTPAVETFRTVADNLTVHNAGR